MQLAPEQAEVDTRLPGLGALRTEVVGRGPGVRDRDAGRHRIGRDGDVPADRVTHLGVGGAHLGERQEVRVDPEDVRQDGGKAHGRIEDGLHLAVLPGQRGGPVVTGRQVQEDHVLEPELGRAEHGLGLVAEGVLEERLPRLHVREGEQVRHAQEVAADGGSAVEVVLDGGAQHAVQLEQVVPEGLVQVQEDVGVGLPGLHVVIVVAAVLAREQAVGRSVELLLGDGRVAVGADPALDVQPVRDVEGQGRSGEEAVLGRVVHVAVHQPERVLHRELVGAPELRREVAVRIEPFVHGIGVQVVAGRHQVQRDQRVVVQTAGEHVLLVHLDVHPQEAQVHPAVQEVHRLVGGEVVAAVLVVGDDAVGAVQAGGDVGGIVLPAQGQAHGVGLVHPGLEEVQDAPVLRDVELAAPGGVLAQLGAVGALQARKHERLGEGRAVGVAHVDAFLTGTGGEHQDTVRGLVAVQGGGGRTHQRAHVGHVLGVEHRHAVTGQAGAGVDAPGVARLGGREGRERNAVQHIQRVVGVLDGLRAAHHHLGLGAGAGRRLVDLDAGQLAREGVHHVGLPGDKDLVVQFLDIVGDRFLGALDAEGRHDDPLQEIGVLLQGDVDGLPAADGHQRVLHADEGEAQRLGAGRNLKCVVSVEVRDRTDGRLSLDDYSCADEGRLVRIHHGARDGPPSLRKDEEGREKRRNDHAEFT